MCLVGFTKKSPNTKEGFGYVVVKQVSYEDQIYKGLYHDIQYVPGKWYKAKNMRLHQWAPNAIGMSTSDLYFGFHIFRDLDSAKLFHRDIQRRRRGKGVVRLFKVKWKNYVGDGRQIMLRMDSSSLPCIVCRERKLIKEAV